MKTGTVLFAAAFLLIGSPSLAAGEDAKAKAVPSATGAMPVKNVETLLDDVSRYQGKQVTISGEIEDNIDPRSFVLESGGIFNDEIVVLSEPATRDAGAAGLKEDTNVTVTGTVRVMPIVDLRKELSWDLDPQVEAELEGARAFIVANRVALKK